MPRTIHAALVCTKGCVRGNNEDNFYFNGDLMELGEMDAGAALDETIADDYQLYAIADGMGGGDNGERAAALAVKLMAGAHDRLRTGDLAAGVDQMARKMNEVIYLDGQQNDSDTEGSTLAALIFRDGAVQVADVGDSRVYLLHNDRLTQISWDHSTVGDLHRAGRLTEEQARKSPMNNMITRFLGMDPDEIAPDYVYQRNLSVLPGMRFMLCSDGLSDLLSRDRLQQMLLQERDPLACAMQLVNAALEESGKDNTTCMVLDILA